MASTGSGRNPLPRRKETTAWMIESMACPVLALAIQMLLFSYW
jgi:hypothetical protein